MHRDTTGYAGGQTAKEPLLLFGKSRGSCVLVVPKTTPGYAGGKEIAYSEE